MPKTLDTIVRAIETSGQTRYAIAKGSGVTQGQLSRLVRGHAGMSIGNVEKLADYLGLKVQIVTKDGTATRTPKRRPTKGK